METYYDLQNLENKNIDLHFFDKSNCYENKGLEESEEYGYTMFNWGGTEEFDIALQFIELLSETTPITLNPIPSSYTTVF
ncbi:hypothetical protein TNCV_1596531 [Trichonephila clavipes]|nr:hypothetical protein TNCV_1596531 [Trichonephila clavipes]